MSLEYWSELSKQTVLISSLLSGFSITVVANLMVAERNDKLANRILQAATLAAGCFLVTVFAMVDIIMTITPGGLNEEISISDFNLSRSIGAWAFTLGLFAITTTIGLSGWTKSKKVGRFTTLIAVLTLLFIFLAMAKVGP